MTGSSPDDAVDDDAVDIEQVKLRLEGEKVHLEREKLMLEISKARYTNLSVFGSLVIAMTAVMGTTLGTYMQKQISETQVMTKTVEIALDAESPYEAKARAEMLAAVFGDRLPLSLQKFPEINPAVFGSRKDGTIELRKELIKLLADKPQQRGQILRDWQVLFPADKWPTLLGGDTSSVRRNP
jgi:hypothetical protein